MANKFHISCLYIPPASSDEYQQDVLSSIGSLATTKDSILLGDFNCPDANWSTLTAPSPFSSAVCNQLYSRNLIQIVTEPTHKHGNILDLITTNVPDSLINLTVNTVQNTLISDHNVVSVEIVGTNCTRRNPAPNATHPPLNYSKMDRPGIVDFMKYNNLESLLSGTSPYTCWNYIKSAILECNRFIPKVRTPSTLSPWFNPTIRHQINKVNTLKRRLKSKPTPQLATKLAQMEDLLTVTMQSAKDQFIQKLTSTISGQPKKLYMQLY